MKTTKQLREMETLDYLVRDLVQSFAGATEDWKIRAIKEFLSEERSRLVELIESMPRKEKHDEIKGVFDYTYDPPIEENDCNVMEAACYNQALDDTINLIKGK